MTYLNSNITLIGKAAVLKEYPDKMTLVFFTCFFGTIQCAVVSLVAERDPSAWKVHSGTELIAAIVGTIYRTSVIAWCLHKKGPVFVALFKPFGTVIAVVMAVMLLGETPHLGSLIGATVIAFGFYAVLWGQAKENTTADKNNSLESSDQKLSFSKNT
ncbi:hypothetical protein Dsin_030808 [Dipteronia sinensis]|uniref:WAT1-related protein n=1 Tax=Dipteronia sinensis TaxID=43782 RepID=A0AAD9ZK29_9ROSI|nr:hypothetical protein Dsin_030808 [Dipteronia sinensis]